MSDGGQEYRVGAKGQVFEAAPSQGGFKALEPKKVRGSQPRNWETRGRFECAAIVATVRGDDGHPRHMACCLPVADPTGDYERGKYPYCSRHWPFQKMKKQTQKEFVRGLRRFIT